MKYLALTAFGPWELALCSCVDEGKDTSMYTETNILLVQFRNDEMRVHEHESIIEHGKIKEDHVTTLDALSEAIHPARAHEYDAILLGGSGDYCVTEKNIESLPAVYELCRTARAARVPSLGICFGAHAMTEAFGGTVEHWPEKHETGSFEVMLNEHATDDPIFSSIPPKYWAQMGHKDFITKLPPGAVHLAYSERAAYQAWKFPNEPTYAIQFHPELTKDGLTKRIMYYLNQYIGDDEGALQEIIDRAQHSDDATRVLTNFMNFVEQHRALRVKAGRA